MNQFFKVDGKWVSAKIMKAIRAEKDRLRVLFCIYCSSGGNRHTKICPTRKEDFNPATAHVLTYEEREAEVLARQK